MKADDADLVRACLAGTTAAFGDLVERYERPIFNVAFRILGDRQAAEDVAQTVFLKAWENLRGYDPKYRFYSWIYRIAINESVNHLKARRAEDPIPGDAVWNGPGPDALTEGADLARAVQRALSGLKPEHRAVIVLRHFAGCSYRDMAETLGIPEKTVKSRLFTARQLLKDLLTAKGIVGV